MLRATGPNALPEEKPIPGWRRFVDQYRAYMQIILSVAAIVSLAIKEWSTAVVLIVLTASSRARVVEAKGRIEAILEPLGLRLHPDKTRISCVSKGQDGFVFLGFEHRMRESWKHRGYWYLNKWPSPRAMASVKAKLKRRTARNR